MCACAYTDKIRMRSRAVSVNALLIIRLVVSNVYGIMTSITEFLAFVAIILLAGNQNVSSLPTGI